MALRDLWTKLDEPSRQAFLRTAMWMVIIVTTVYALGQSDYLQNDGPMALIIDAPEKIIFPKSNAVVNLPVALELKNNTAEPAQLEVSSPCNIIRWYVTTEAGEFVQAPAEEVCSQVVMRATLPAGQISQDGVEIPLAADRYKSGAKYQLMLRYWGQDSQHLFNVEFE